MRLDPTSRGTGTDAILERRRLEYERTGRVTPESQRAKTPAERSAPPSARVESRSTPPRNPALEARIAAERAAERAAQRPAYNGFHSGTGLRSVDPLNGQQRAILEGSLADYDAAHRARESFGTDEVSYRVSDYIVRGHEHRFMGITAGAAGGYLVPQGSQFGDEVLLALRYFSSIFGRARIWHTSTGAPATYPMAVADVSNNATATSENTLQAEGDLTIARIVFGQATPFMAANLVRMSRGLAADSQANLTSLIAEAFGQRIGRAIDSAYMTTVLANASIPVVTTANATDITLSDLANAVFTLDLAARGAPSAAIIVSNATAKYLASKLVDDSHRPLLDQQSFVTTQESTTAFGGSISRSVRVPCWNGMPIVTSPYIADVGTAGSIVAVIADWDSAFVARIVDDSMAVQRLEERFADYGELAWSGFFRADGAVGDPNAAVFLTQHA